MNLCTVKWAQCDKTQSREILAKCKPFNLLYAGRGKHLPSTVKPIAAKQIYMMSELGHQHQKIFIPQFNYHTTDI